MPKLLWCSLSTTKNNPLNISC
uniref:Uncharacterized protein n=1 Tax=Rhizophora mucronata TaxID=61149 RepID=A0A2P2NXK5_RHIMU